MDPLFVAIANTRAKEDAAIFVQEYGEPYNEAETDWDADPFSELLQEVREDITWDNANNMELAQYYRDMLASHTESMCVK